MDFIDHRSTANFIFSLSATDEKFRIKSDGNVGIGVSNPSTKLEVDGVITTAGLTTTADINFGDNDKAIFGAGSDLQIYHDGSNSYIAEGGTGNLQIQGQNLSLEDSTGTRFFLGIQGGETRLYNQGNEKVAVTSTGIGITGNATFDDNGKAVFGAGSDLQIYHDGSHSRIDDTGTGKLILRGNDAVEIHKYTGEYMITAVADGAVSLYHNDLLKLATTSTGIDVTGTVVSDGLTLADGGDRTITGPLNNDLIINSRGNTPGEGIRLQSLGSDRLVIDDTTGDISFYEDTGTTAKLTWSASNEKLTVDNNVASSAFVITKGNTTGNALEISNSGSSRALDINHNADGTGTVDDAVRIKDNGTTKFVIDENYNVGIGTSSIDYQASNRTVVHIEGSAGALLALEDTGAKSYLFQTGNDLLIENDTSTGSMIFGTNASTERMRIDSSGNLLVGTTSTTADEGGLVLIPQVSDVSHMYIGHATGTSGGNPYMYFRYGSGNIGSITQSGTTAVLYNTSSDQRLKDNIVDAPSASDDIDAIQVRSFDWKADGSHQKYGMVAQELQSVAPEAVSGDADSDDMMGVDYSKLVPMLVKEIQSLRARVAQLETN